MRAYAARTCARTMNGAPSTYDWICERLTARMVDSCSKMSQSEVWNHIWFTSATIRARLHAFHTCKRNLRWSDLRWHIHNATRSIGRHPVHEHSVKMLQRNHYNIISWDHIHGPHNICRLWVKLPQGNNAIRFAKICTTHTHCYQQMLFQGGRKKPHLQSWCYHHYHWHHWELWSNRQKRRGTCPWVGSGWCF